MLKIIRLFRDLQPSQLCNVYEQSLLDNCAENYPHETASLALLYEQQSFYDYMQFFLSDENTLCAVWTEGEKYCSALRLEPFRDGFLLSGLETAPGMRCKGYASMLLRSFLAFCESRELLPIYSHISNENTASITVHMRSGFSKVLDGASYLDGNVDWHSKTYRFSGNKKDEVV